MKYTEDLVPRVFFDALTPKLKLLFEDILEEGMTLTMVGGATRDFLLNGRVPKDIDLEVRMEIHLEEEEWKKNLFVLGQKLKASHEVEFLPFGILRIPLGDTVVEISSPRVEQYSEKGPWGHSDFSAKLSSTLSHEDSFRRRDFTINSIGFDFSDLLSLRIQDPYRGIDDLKAGILRPCSEDFFKDPVRDPHESFLRGFLGKMLFTGEEALKKTNVLSGGEKVRCMLSKMMLSSANVLILDGPTNHLDLESITAVNDGLIRYRGTILFASHDHQFIQTVANRVISLEGKTLRDEYTTYDQFLGLES